MKNHALILFIILILGLILCSFLGGNCGREGYTDMAKVTLASGVTDKPDSTSSSTSTKARPSGGNFDNYDHFSGSSAPTIYYGPNGSTATVSKWNDGKCIITVTLSNGKTKQYTLINDSVSDSGSGSGSGSESSSVSTKTTSSNFAKSMSSMMKQISNKTFYGPNGGSARLFSGNDGQYAIEETLANGNTIIYTATNTYTYTYSYNNQQANGSNSNTGSSPTSSQTSSPSSTTSSSTSVYPFSDIMSDYSSGHSSSYNDNNQYNSSLPKGIPGRMIPPGQEDLYILKSEVVPPVCPACPSSAACPRTEKCPPCPACARCPEPSFECKKVPNYNAVNDQYLPMPVLSNFSTFGM
jgi:hypothetical protein